ncbi:zeta toxin family protein [Verminephrobacter aporrectodeae]|uniref:AAA family ATPase n=1 Tax=Verminephrobacter aporrectodeae subsp. tuberculatae TaxID=1110392 RepID=A0ABT3KSH9_9BURK|nr:zeta toxin family protein [Verminephrobacter aporrectodeae]MCW5257565.1 AAA family ATPase [Verminephrobacter aporrectodeae subsp. tuberculatae]MCW5321273.1 AAA family ATPase [Verminephrobacter aporrectodeae subsp. tuberculatae]MCW8174445.1 AAA family ATPase [Verminephrobacter aporrectodeae subsp. tuberculatae]MCW8201784.1 AAA family ATPase [Verminephrobacter aporrectodeae subsp. tuberculatae]MCW8208549.1 AAA family ATPase [Verminephrobacter aporrectodeae subsp. tuberculatae]
MTKPRPTLIVVAGPNGSGKTSLTTEVLQHQWIEGCIYINPDNIARDVFGDWNSLESVMAAAKYAEAERERCLHERESMAFESVLSAPDKIDFIQRAKDAGYFVRIFFVGTDHPSINAARVSLRVMEGGHDVPISKIISRYSKSIANCAAAAAFVDRAYIYDNSVDGEEPRLLFRTVEGEIVKVYNAIHGWAQFIVETLPHGQEPSHAQECDHGVD